MAASIHMTLCDAAIDDENRSFSNSRPKKVLTSNRRLPRATARARSRGALPRSQAYGVEQRCGGFVHALAHGQLHEDVLERALLLQAAKPVHPVVRDDLSL